METWIQLGEVERRLGVSGPVVARLVAEGRIGTLTLPGVRRRSYSAADVDALVSLGTVPATAGVELVGI